MIAGVPQHRKLHSTLCRLCPCVRGHANVDFCDILWPFFPVDNNIFIWVAHVQIFPSGQKPVSGVTV